MAFIYADRVKEQSITVGLGAMTLTGPATGFQTFNTAVGVGNQTFYTIVNDADNTWEVGSGTLTAPITLSRDTILDSSSGGAQINFIAGTKTVFAGVAAQFFSGAIDTAAHGAINHNGLPGVPAAETFDSTAHDAVDHTAAPFNLFDVAAHDATDHKAAPFNLLDEPAHDLLNHAGLPGVDANPATVSQAEAEAGTATIDRLWTSERVKQSIEALNSFVKQVRFQTGASANGTTTVPDDDSIPQKTEGTQFMSLAITPSNAANILLIDVVIHLSHSNVGGHFAAALFTAGADALAVSISTAQLQNHIQNIKLSHRMVAGTTSPLNFTVRGGHDRSGTVTFNGLLSARLYGGVMASSINIREYLP